MRIDNLAFLLFGCLVVIWLTFIAEEKITDYQRTHKVNISFLKAIILALKSPINLALLCVILFTCLCGFVEALE
jgi:hypothetical protein